MNPSPPVGTLHVATTPPEISRRIALVAHDNKKRDLLEWSRYNRTVLEMHDLYGTGTTGGLIQDELGLPVTRFRSGPLGGDQILGRLAVHVPLVGEAAAGEHPRRRRDLRDRPRLRLVGRGHRHRAGPG